MTPEQIAELIKAASIPGDAFATGAVLIVRTKDMDNGDTKIHVGRSEDTDHFALLGLLLAASDIVRHMGFGDAS